MKLSYIITSVAKIFFYNSGLGLSSISLYHLRTTFTFEIILILVQLDVPISSGNLHTVSSDHSNEKVSDNLKLLFRSAN